MFYVIITTYLLQIFTHLTLKHRPQVWFIDFIQLNPQTVCSELFSGFKVYRNKKLQLETSDLLS